MISKDVVLELLKEPRVVSTCGMEFDEIKDYFKCGESELKMIIIGVGQISTKSPS